MIQAITRALVQSKRYAELVRHVRAHGPAALPDGWGASLHRDPAAPEFAWFQLVLAAATFGRGGEPERVMRCFCLTAGGALMPRWARWYTATGFEAPAPSYRLKLDVPLEAVLNAH